MVLREITIFPIKSLDGTHVPVSEITLGGTLKYDRIYALVDSQGKVINGKRTPQVHRLRTTFNSNFREVGIRLQDATDPTFFDLEYPSQLNRWLSDFFGFTVQLIAEKEKGFPDDLIANGPTLISTASLQAVATWFPDLTLQSLRRRFRSNLEIDEVPAFWEDQLFGKPGQLKPFRIGAVRFFGHNPCQRCAVPARDPETAEVQESFQKMFQAMRKKTLPVWSQPEQFNHFFRLAVNTSIPFSETEKALHTGDLISISNLSTN